jgi:hypothetical protein
MRQYGFRRDVPCRWGTSWNGEEPCWECWHEETCLGCGKVLRMSISDGECPGWHPMTDADRVRVDAEIGRHREILAEHAARHRVITGPQGYRKRRSA